MTLQETLDRLKRYPSDTEQKTLALLKRYAIERGYGIEVSEDGTEERLIRPDGTVAVIARKVKDKP